MEAANESNENYEVVPIELIVRGEYQARTHFDQETLEELSENILKVGLINPVTLSHQQVDGKDVYELIAGERRWRACQMAGLTEIPATVFRGLTNKDKYSKSVAENGQRDNLKPTETARDYLRGVEEFGYTHQELAEEFSKSRPEITNFIRLLELPPAVQEMVDQDKIKLGHAKVILSAPAAHHFDLASKASGQQWSVRRLEKEISKLKGGAKQGVGASSTGNKDPDIRRLETEVSESLGSPFEITQSSNGAYILQITCFSLDEVDNAVTRCLGKIPE